MSSTKSSPHTAPPKQSEKTAVQKTIWNTRRGETSTASVLYDSSELLILSFMDSTQCPTTVEEQQSHQEAAVEWADTAGVDLPDAEAYLAITPSLETDWSLELSEQYEAPLRLLDYSVNFVYPKWKQYDASVYAWVEIPGQHGTLRHEVKLQGLATHRPNAADEVQMWQSLHHIETGRELETETNDSYILPEARNHSLYPNLPIIRNSVYNSLFEPVPLYRNLSTSNLTVCDRCGMFEDTCESEETQIMQLTDPTDGRQRNYCTHCYTKTLTAEYGVLEEVVQLYIRWERGTHIDTLATEFSLSASKLQDIFTRLDRAITEGKPF